MLAPAAAAALGAVAAAGGTLFWQGESARYRSCVPDPAILFSCTGLWPLRLAIGLPLVLALVGLLLHLGGQRRAVLVVLGGAVATFAYLGLYESAVYGTPPPPLWLGALLGFAGFGLAALAVPPGRHWSLRLAVALSLVAALGLAPVLDPLATRAHRRERLSANADLLVVPQVDGYDLRSASVYEGQRALSATLASSRDPSDLISTVVIPVPGDFAPPVRCGPRHWQVSGPAVTNEECAAHGANHWIRVSPVDVEHVVRRADVLVLVSADPRRIPEADLERAASQLRAATVDELLDRY